MKIPTWLASKMGTGHLMNARPCKPCKPRSLVKIGPLPVFLSMTVIHHEFVEVQSVNEKRVMAVADHMSAI